MTEAFQKQIEWWRESSKEDFGVAKVLFEQKHYSHSLFFCHLSAEKLLKAIVMKRTGDFAPFTHDLRRLVEIGGVEIGEERGKILEEMFTFHIAGRYAPEKLEFYQKYNNQGIAKEWVQHTENLLIWLQAEYQKK